MADKNQNVGAEIQPGDTIRPGDAQPQAASTPAKPVAPTAPAAAELVTEQPHFFNADAAQAPLTNESHGTDDSISWTASEFVDHHKSVDWYLALAVVAIISAVGLYFLFHDIITSITPLVAALAFGFYGRRQPRQLQYQLDSHGLTIGTKHFSYAEFRSFAVVEEGPFASVIFLPLKRFGLLTTVYLDPQDEDRALGLVSQFLPMEPRQQDTLDRLLKRIRF